MPRARGRRPVTRRRGILIAFLGLAVCFAARDAAASGSDLERGDQLYARGQMVEAGAAYRAALDRDSRSLRALCGLARVESELAETRKGEEQRQLIASAVEHGRAAVAAAPDSAQGHVWLAVALGRQALKEGPKTRLALSREIKSEVDRAIAIDPGNGRAYHVRALWNRKLASLSFLERGVANSVLGGVPKGASMENAVRDLQKAVELEPDYIHHRLELGRTYLMLKDREKARRELERAISLRPGGSALDGSYQAEARELMAKLRRD